MAWYQTPLAEVAWYQQRGPGTKPLQHHQAFQKRRPGTTPSGKGDLFKLEPATPELLAVAPLGAASSSTSSTGSAATKAESRVSVLCSACVNESSGTLYGLLSFGTCTAVVGAEIFGMPRTFGPQLLERPYGTARVACNQRYADQWVPTVKHRFSGLGP